MAYSVYANNFSPVNPAALALFKSVDTDRSGKVDFRELHRALTHGGSQPFSIKTSRLLMRMFDVSGDGQLGYREFETLIQQVQSWRHWFDQADRDRSDTLSSHELANALAAFGYHLPAQTTDRVFSAVDANSSGSIRRVVAAPPAYLAVGRPLLRRLSPRACGLRAHIPVALRPPQLRRVCAGL